MFASYADADTDADSGVDLKLGSDCGCFRNLKNVRHHIFDFFQMSRFLLDFIPSIGDVASEFITCMNHIHYDRKAFKRHPS